ncbi:hypothetical protein [Chondrinema litorale]|uniref:hypothetical protein n=1 Tax=Chondrinema litorale TaxID=2994555 RepID=UPI0025430240|nr:hypothetical protein [Chondrinema litorale]UZR93463.1 hypothetical protein OQ292_16540 [Chondrinema litorale]
MNERQIIAINNLEKYLPYFKNFSNENKRFYPEYDIIFRILKFIKSKTELTQLDFEEVLSIYQDHYDGSAWFDIKEFRLPQLIRVFGYEVGIDEKTQKLYIKG